MKPLVIAVFLALIFSPGLMSQKDPPVNQTDRDGKKQGHWIKKYPNGNILYDGYFVNDHPAGEFKRYYEDNTLKSVLIFSKNGIETAATLYHGNGFRASAGKYVNQMKEGRWKFFSPTTKDLLISEIDYSADKKNGLQIIYYPDNKVAEKINYRNDLKHGECLKYYPDGKVTLRTSYVDGKLDGKFEAYFENGRFEMTGQYKNNLREGTWIIYREGGNERFRINYTAGMPDNRKIDIYESEYIDSLEKTIVRIKDPEKTGEIW
jgi:antitoxin component YwqK of YwqJK toxin-antitoxin module